MRKLIIAFLMIGMWFTAIKSYSQCTAITPTELVDNGDFEKGYLKSNGTLYPDNSSRKFLSDLTYAFDFTGTNCANSMPDQFGIGKCESATTLSPGCAPPSGCNNPYAGYSYLAGTTSATSFKDHTPGKGGSGYALVMDFSSCNSSSKSNAARTYANGYPVAWAQKVNVIAGQKYYFSGYFAQYTFSPSTNSRLYFVVQPLDGSGNPTLRNTVTPIGNATPTNATMDWRQFYAEWTNPYGNATVMISIEIDVTTTPCNTAGDFAFDDISFINGCQNLAGAAKPTFPASTANLCSTAGSSINLTASYTGTPVSIQWYQGTSTQTLISGANSLTYAATAAGTYRICVWDGNCPASATIVVDDKITVDFPSAVNLCSPAIATLSPTITPATGTKNYAWTVPSGATTPGTSSATATANVPGTYTLTVTHPSKPTCTGSDNITVTSTLPTAPTTLTYCSGGGTPTNLVVGDGKKYNWYSNASKAALNGTVTNNGTVTTTWTPATGTTGDQTLYIQSNETVAAGTLQTKNLTDDSGVPEITITVNSTVLIKSFEAYVSTYGSSGTITATLSGAGTGTSTVNYTAGNNTYYTFNTNWMLSPGTYKLNLTKTGGGSFKIVSTGTNLSITEVSISGAGAWLGIRNMVVEKATNACDPIPVVVKAVACCTQPTPGLSITTGSASTCVGNNIVFTATPNGATGTVVYEWYKGATVISGQTGATLTLNPVAAADAGSYQVLIKSSGGCAASGSKSTAITLTVNAKPTVSLTPATPKVCVGSTVTLAGTPTGGTFSSGTPANATIVSGTGVATGVAAGTSVITYSYTDANSCSNTATQTLTVNAKPAVSLTPATPKVCVGSTVTLAGTPTGGTFSSGTTANATIVSGTGVATGVAAGTSVITYSYTDANSCSNTATQTLTVNGLPTVTLNPATPAVCIGSTVTLTGNPTGGTFNSGTPANATIVSGTGVASGVAAGTSVITYSFTDANSCTNTATRTLTVNGKPAVTLNPATPTVCVGSTVTLAGNPTGGTFSSGTTANATIVSGTGVATGVAAGTSVITYSYTDANSCTNTATRTLTVNALPSTSITPSSGAGLHYCAGTSGVTLTASGSSGDKFEWFLGGATQGVINGVNTRPNSTAGNWTVIRTDANGCASPVSAAVTIVADPAPSAGLTVTGVTPICTGVNGTITIAASETGVNYEAFKGASSVSSSVAGTGGTITITIPSANLTAGNNTITIKATKSGCNVVTLNTQPTIVVNVNNTINLSSASGTDAQNACVGAAITPIIYTTTGATGATVTGLPAGVNGSWASNTVTISGTPTTPGAALTYTITLTGGCGTITKTGTIAVNAAVVATASPVCRDNLTHYQLKVVVTAGSVPTQANFTVKNAATSAVVPVTWTEFPTGTWTSSDISETITVNLEISNSNGCAGQIINNLKTQCSCPAFGAISLASGSPSALCANGATTVTQTSINVSFGGGTGNYDITLYNGSTLVGTKSNQAGSASPVTFTGISGAGTYTAQIHSLGAENCTVTASSQVVITSLPTPDVSLTGTVTSACAGTSFTMNVALNPGAATPASPGWSYVYNNGGTDITKTVTTGSSSAVLSDATVGTYVIKSVTDANGCLNNSPTASSVTTQNFIAVAASHVEECNDVNPSLAFNEYQIKVTVTAGDLSTINITKTSGSGTVTFTRVGSTNVWVSNAINESNTVGINVTDVNNCGGGVPFTNIVRRCSCPVNASMAFTGTGAVCTGATATINVSYSGGTAGTTYDVELTQPDNTKQTLTGQTGASSSFTVSLAGIYTATVKSITDNCTASASSVTLVVNPLPTVVAHSSSAAVCSGSTVTLTGSGALTYTWDNGATDNTPVVVTNTTTFTVTGTDANGCKNTSTVQVTANPAPSPITFTSAVNACEGSDATITLNGTESSSVNYIAYIGGAQVAQTPGNGFNKDLLIPGSKLSPGTNTVEIRAESAGCPAVPNGSATITVLGKSGTITGLSKVCGGEAAAVPYSVSSVAGATDYVWTALPSGITVQTGSLNTLANFNGLTGSETVTTIMVQPSIGTFNCGAAFLISKQVTWVPAYNGVTIVGKEPKLCINETITLDLSNTNAKGFSWSTSDENAVKATPTSLFSADVKFTKAGTYNVTISPSLSPCKVLPDSIVTVTVYDLPIANAGNDDFLENYATINLDGSGSSQGADYTYSWTSPNANPAIANPNVMSTTAAPKALHTTYFLTVGYKDPNLAVCTSTDSKEVIIDLKVETPNVFSPNGDGIHDTFILPNIDLFPNAVVYIYNQWGELVFKSQPGYTNPWDGRRGNTACTIGTYYFLLDFHADGYKPIAGAVSIVR